MNKLLEKLQDSLMEKFLNGPTLRAEIAMQQELVRQAVAEMDIDLQEELRNESRGFDKRLAETIHRIKQSVLVSFIHGLDTETLIAVYAATSHPDYKVSEKLVGRTVDQFEGKSLQYVREEALDFASRI